MRINWTYDEIVLVAEVTRLNDWRSIDQEHPAAVRLSKLLRASTLHPLEGREISFRNPSGVARKSADIRAHHPGFTGSPTNGNKLDAVVLADFLADPETMSQEAARIEELLERGDLLFPADDGREVGVSEGRVLLAAHYRRERNAGMRRQKLQSVINDGQELSCEVCAFNFQVTYGERGTGYIEVHHVLPLHISGETQTKLADLALLCSNCHRMMHRSPWTTPAALRQRLSTEA